MFHLGLHTCAPQLGHQLKIAHIMEHKRRRTRQMRLPCMSRQAAYNFPSSVGREKVGFHFRKACFTCRFPSGLQACTLCKRGDYRWVLRMDLKKWGAATGAVGLQSEPLPLSELRYPFPNASNVSGRVSVTMSGVRFILLSPPSLLRWAVWLRTRERRLGQMEQRLRRR